MKQQDKTHQINHNTVNSIDIFNLSHEPNISFHTGQSAEDITLLRFFSKRKNGFYVDIGAYDPYKYSNTFLLHRLYGWRGINIDPSPESIKKFNKSRPRDININCAVDSSEGEKTYFKFSGSARNTLSPENVNRQNKKNDVVAAGEDVVTTQPLKNILKKHLPEKTHIDVMNIDVEGLEIDVLDSNDWSIFRPTIIVIEDYAIQESELSSSPIYKYLSKQNYRFFSHHFDTSFYIDALSSNPLGNLEEQSRQEFLQNLRAINNSKEILAEIKDRFPDTLLPYEANKLKKELLQARKDLEEMKMSVSWKITEPLRSVANRFEKAENKKKK